jgi:hypothetical protein
MRDGGELPIHRVLRLDHHEEYHGTCNLTEKRKGMKSVRSERGGRREGKKKNSGKYRVSDSGK